MKKQFRFAPQRVAIRRKLIGKTQAKMAEELGVSLAMVRRWESGATTPSLNQIWPIMRCLNVSLQYILGVRDDPRPFYDLSSEEIDLIYHYRELTGEKRRAWQRFLLLTEDQKQIFRELVVDTLAANEAMKRSQDRRAP